MTALPRIALSINQPWAWLIAAGHKDIENRGWRTDFRGEFLIHAGLKVDHDAAEAVAKGASPADGELLGILEPPTLLTGGMVGVARLVDCITAKDPRSKSPWFFGKYGFLIIEARPIEFIPCVGKIGFFEPDYSRTYVPKPERKERAPPSLEAPPHPDLFG